ncbi:hypothetical protein ACFOY8_13115 [Thalassospira xianhensis]|uniref:Type II secretory pathway, pseudopilin PulG n=2 Tax=Thalassospira TaxID=168934 RepID=A0A285TUS2_9PROT|nr:MULTISPECIES: hypothetical protein [Thalassospira]RCK07852.1 hypothetical protein TH5_02175 [Thalassospira xianhensis MCCC 1A02616]SOC27244.1 hypothetical protein SAMN05428964_105322 [Thalassospira xiamenensis]
MYSLVAIVLSIALSILIALAAMYYGGSVFSEGGAKSDFTGIRNGAFQIEAALNMYKSDIGNYPAGTSDEILNELVEESYLTAIPTSVEGFEYKIENGTIVRAIAGLEQCYSINQISGVTTTEECPPCSDTAYQHYPACEGS